MEKEPSAEDLKRLDRTAEPTQAGNAAFGREEGNVEQEEDLTVPPVMKSYSPVAGSCEVRLAL